MRLCLSVCHNFASQSSAKTDKHIELIFGSTVRLPVIISRPAKLTWLTAYQDDLFSLSFFSTFSRWFRAVD